MQTFFLIKNQFESILLKLLIVRNERGGGWGLEGKVFLSYCSVYKHESLL